MEKRAGDVKHLLLFQRERGVHAGSAAATVTPTSADLRSSSWTLKYI